VDECRSELFGVPLDLLTEEESVQRCCALVEERRPAQHVVLNAGKVVMLSDVPRLRQIVSSCDIVNADGQSVVLAGRLVGIRVPERVAGIDLMERLLDEAERRAWPVYFLGARQSVLDELVRVVRTRYPNLQIAGHHHGYFEDDAAVAAGVCGSGARLLFVGMSSPRKEFFLADSLSSLGPIFAMGVGGSFDVIAGVTRRAPLWMRRLGMEWLYRFLQEPGRMWRRYLIGNARFAVLLAREWWRVRILASKSGSTIA
jgi:N-acetylglucosaminyldiphosphoundecaprenol N-acetyl-beta-D-mannosaminyltransferase